MSANKAASYNRISAFVSAYPKIFSSLPSNNFAGDGISQSELRLFIAVLKNECLGQISNSQTGIVTNRLPERELDETILLYEWTLAQLKEEQERLQILRTRLTMCHGISQLCFKLISLLSTLHPDCCNNGRGGNWVPDPESLLRVVNQLAEVYYV